MTESAHATLLRRMTRSQKDEVAENPLTASRAVRLALTKAANDTVGLVLTVSGVADEVTVLDDMLATLGDDLMLIGLERGDQLQGLVALDMQLRSAVVELQTTGVLVGQTAEDRAPTRTDKMLCDPLLSAFLAAFPTAVLSTPLEGWMEGVTHGDRVESARAAGLVLEDVNYRIVRMSVDLGVADRNGMLVIALPLVQEAAPEIAEPPVVIDWEHAFGAAVSESTASLDALLHRFSVPLATAKSLEIGSVLPLPGCTVNSVRLIAPDGQCVGHAKLGQAAGHRAVRLEHAAAPQLSDLPAHRAIPNVGAEHAGDMAPELAIDALADPVSNLSTGLPESDVPALDDSELGTLPEQTEGGLADVNLS